MDHDIEVLTQTNELSYLLNACWCKMIVYYEQNKIEIIQLACRLSVSSHNHNNFSTASTNKVKCRMIK